MKESRNFGIVVGSSVSAVLLVLILAIVVVIDSRRTDNRQDHADKRIESLINQRELDQQQARYGSCVQQNVDKQRQRAGFIEQGEVLIRQVPASAQRADNIAKYRADLQTSAERTFPYRDCSPKGIEEYLSHPPADPNVSAPTAPAPPP